MYLGSNCTGKITDEELLVMQNALNIIRKIQHEWWSFNADSTDDEENYWMLVDLQETFENVFGLKPIDNVDTEEKVPTTVIILENNRGVEIATIRCKKGTADFLEQCREIKKQGNKTGGFTYNIRLNASVDTLEDTSVDKLLAEIRNRIKE